MASTRSSAPAELAAAVAASARRDLGPAHRIAVAFSGGRDSVALLHALAVLAHPHASRLTAIHVHHGLSAHADAWADFCAGMARDLGVGFAAQRVQVPRTPRHSLEAAARTARHAALAAAARSCGADTLALAHHADDQAETLLLQLFRGAGPAGLAAMPVCRDIAGIAWWRPLLAVPRTTIDAYVQAHALCWVDDDSNNTDRFRRNALRHHVIPALRDVAPGYPATLVRSATLQAEAADLLDTLAAIDSAAAFDGHTLARAALAALPPPRARNLLRWFLRQRGLPPPSLARTAAMLAQLGGAQSGAHPRIAHAGAELGVHAGRVHVHAPAPPPFARAWRGEASLVLPHGELRFSECRAGNGDAVLATARLAGAAVSVRSRRGGERFTPDPMRPHRALKGMLQHSRLPPWERAALPLVFCDDALVAVPGIGVDADYRAPAGTDGIAVAWAPHGDAPLQSNHDDVAAPD